MVKGRQAGRRNSGEAVSDCSRHDIRRKPPENLRFRYPLVRYGKRFGGLAQEWGKAAMHRKATRGRRSSNLMAVRDIALPASYALNLHSLSALRRPDNDSARSAACARAHIGRCRRRWPVVAEGPTRRFGRPGCGIPARRIGRSVIYCCWAAGSLAFSRHPSELSALWAGPTACGVSEPRRILADASFVLDGIRLIG